MSLEPAPTNLEILARGCEVAVAFDNEITVGVAETGVHVQGCDAALAGGGEVGWVEVLERAAVDWLASLGHVLIVFV